MISDCISFLSSFYRLCTVFFFKACFDGVCAWSKCSNVHKSQTDNCGVYNGGGISSVGTEVFDSCNWKVTIFFFIILLIHVRKPYNITRNLKSRLRRMILFLSGSLIF